MRRVGVMLYPTGHPLAFQRFRAGGVFVPQDVYRLNVGVINPASAFHTDSLVSVALLLRPALTACRRGACFRVTPCRGLRCIVSGPVALSIWRTAATARPVAATACRCCCCGHLLLPVQPHLYHSRTCCERQGHAWYNAWQPYFSPNAAAPYLDSTAVGGVSPSDDMYLYQSMCGALCCGIMHAHCHTSLPAFPPSGRPPLPDCVHDIS